MRSLVAPQRGYDEPAILSYAISSFCPTSADGLHPIESDWQERCRVFEVRHRRNADAPDWLKVKHPDAPAVTREAEEDWGISAIGAS
jgi:hypothetical protein